MLFVFSAGNAGDGNDTNDPGEGKADSIQSPATAKNVVTVGASEEQRDITNLVTAGPAPPAPCGRRKPTTAPGGLFEPRQRGHRD